MCQRGSSNEEFSGCKSPKNDTTCYNHTRGEDVQMRWRPVLTRPTDWKKRCDQFSGLSAELAGRQTGRSKRCAVQKLPWPRNLKSNKLFWMRPLDLLGKVIMIYRKAPCCKVAAQGTKVKEPKAGLSQLSNKNQLDVLELFELLIYVADPVCRHTKLERKTVKT